MTGKTRERQYQRCVTLDESEGRARLGLMSNQVWIDDPRRLVFTLSRYKFVAKMFEGKDRVLEIGCGDAFATNDEVAHTGFSPKAHYLIGSSILDGWVENLSRGDVIHPFSNMVMAPLTLPFTVAALTRNSQLDRGGVFQVSAATDISYAAAAAEIAAGLGADPSLVQPARADQAGIPAAMRPAHTSLDTERLQEKLGFADPIPWRRCVRSSPSMGLAERMARFHGAWSVGKRKKINVRAPSQCVI